MLRSRYACPAPCNTHSFRAVYVQLITSAQLVSTLAEKELHTSAHAAACSGLTFQAYLCLGPSSGMLVARYSSESA